MKNPHLASLSSGLYRAFFRLYPPAFRRDFGDEMLIVFQLRLAELQHQSRMQMALFLLRETTSLVKNGLRERLREYHKQQIVLFSRGELQQPVRFARFHTLTLIVVVAAFVWLIFVPFYAYGLHLKPAAMVAGGNFDPKGFPVYYSTIGCYIRLLSMIVALLTPLWIAGFGSLLGITLVRYWVVIPARQRAYSLVALSLASGLMVFLSSPVGRVIVSWFWD